MKTIKHKIILSTYSYHVKLGNSVLFNTKWEWDTILFDQHNAILSQKSHKPIFLNYLEKCSAIPKHFKTGIYDI